MKLEELKELLEIERMKKEEDQHQAHAELVQQRKTPIKRTCLTGIPLELLPKELQRNPGPKPE